ncbi:MAG: hypothetical protein J0M25_11405 [Flavobacteriales bacterium]|nr:hypothetical protein [Flavobacteriales bacterium]
MNKFQSEAYQNFINSHIRLNNYVKISTGAVLNLHNEYKDPIELSVKLNSIIFNAGERWTQTILKNSHTELQSVTNDLAKSGIIWAYSSFDVYFKKVEGYLSGHFVSEKSRTEDDEDDKSHKIVELYEKLKWDQTKIIDLLPILKFYEALRHSVAHNMGHPSGKLLRIYEGKEFKKAIDQWQTKFPNRQISPPPVVTNKIIALRPHHPIMYSETCLRIASDINLKLIVVLGRKHFIQQTIKKHLLDAPILSIPHCQNLSRYIVFHLNNDYKINLKKFDDFYEVLDDIPKDLKEQTIKNYKRRYNTLKQIG